MTRRVRALLHLVTIAVVAVGTVWGGGWLHVPGFHAWETQVYGIFLIVGWFTVGKLDRHLKR